MNQKIKNFKELRIWKLGKEISIETYGAVKAFPNEEKFGLTSQIRRSAVSIPSNIAEGAGRNTEKQFINFLGISSGSAYELQTQLLLAQRLKLVEKSKVETVINEVIEVQKMNYALIKSLEKRIK